jgi:hypothetical protein
MRRQDAPEQGLDLVKQSPASIWRTYTTHDTSRSSTPCATPPWLSRLRYDSDGGQNRKAPKQGIGAAEANRGGAEAAWGHGQGKWHAVPFNSFFFTVF